MLLCSADKQSYQQLNAVKLRVESISSHLNQRFLSLCICVKIQTQPLWKRSVINCIECAVAVFTIPIYAVDLQII